MAQDPEPEEDLIDPSHDLDMVPLFTLESEMEADVVRGILDANGVPSILVRAAGIPSFGFEVRVPREREEEARRLVAEQREAGPEAAVEGEAASERGE